MPDRFAQERLSDWRSAEHAEQATEEGSVARRRAVASTRRARWAFEDAARAAALDHGGPPESTESATRRGWARLREASANAEAIGRSQPRPDKRLPPETDEQRTKRVEDEAEIRRELDE